MIPGKCVSHWIFVLGLLPEEAEDGVLSAVAGVLSPEPAGSVILPLELDVLERDGRGAITVTVGDTVASCQVSELVSCEEVVSVICQGQ